MAGGAGVFAPPVSQHEPKPAAGRRSLPTRGGSHGVGNQALLRQQATPGRLQAKLTVGAVNDPLEREADHVAEQVMRMPDADAELTPAPLQVGRKCAACAVEDKVRAKPAAALQTGEAPASVHAAIGRPGKSLDGPTRSFFEPRFGQDLTGVRVHADAPAAVAAHAVGAQAFTVGSHIAFAQDRYRPHSETGRQLIAHELAHVLQQSPELRRAPDDPAAPPPAANPAPPPAGPAPAASAAPACAPIGAAAQAACSEKNPVVTDETTGRLVLWNARRAKCLAPLTDAQQADMQQVESDRVAALDKTLSTLQRVQKAILMGLKRYPGDPSWDADKTFFHATRYMAIRWYNDSKTYYFDYYNNADDKNNYDNLDATGAVLARNLSFQVYKGRYLCDGSLDEGTGAMGTPDGIVIPPDWFKESAGYKLLTLTHEYFHVIADRLTDDYPAFMAGGICKFSDAINEANCLSGMVAWTYTGTDEQRKARGVVPCTPGGYPPP